jgi:protease-4
MSEQPAESIIQAFIQDRKRDRLWRNLRFGIGILVILFIILALMGLAATSNLDDDHLDHSKPYIAVVKLNGEITSEAPFSARKAIPQIQKAFKDSKARAVILLIDSPGGTPVNASQIYHEILRQKKLHPKTPVIAVGEEMLTSAAYLVATAADSIYVNENTITGSIGVLMSSFGFNNAINKLGIERRAFTAGAHKDRLDPFKPLDPADKTKIQQVLNLVHTNFINYVKATRGNKLKGDPNELFSGDFWTGSEAVSLGLVDGAADLEDIMLKFKVDQYQSYSPKRSLLKQFMSDVGEETTFRLQGSRNKVRAEF